MTAEPGEPLTATTKRVLLAMCLLVRAVGGEPAGGQPTGR
jgi:hypothetical protein